MPVPTEITVAQLSRRIGLAGASVIVDVRTAEDYQTDSRLVPGSVRRGFGAVSSWAKEFSGRSVVVICQKGLKLSQGVAAEPLEGGLAAWK